MSRSSSSSTPKTSSQLSSKSAWSKGPPQNSTVPSRSQSPAPGAQTQSSHARRPSTLGQGVHVKDGVSVPRNNVGAVKQGSAVTFGSIDDVSAPISSSPASTPPVKFEGAKTFGSVPNAHLNGKASVSSRPAAGSSSSSPSTPAVSVPAATPAKPKMDMHKFFQNPSSQPSTSSTSTDTSSPATRPSPLPSQQPSSNQSNQQPPPSSNQPSSFTPFVANSRPQQQNTGPGSGPPPRSPAYPRQLTNGGGPRPQAGPSNGPSAGMSSPRLGTHPPSGMPPPPMPAQMQPPQMPVGWPGYYYPDQHYMPPYSGWYPMPSQMPPPSQHQHQHPSHHPPAGPHGSGVPMSPRTHLPPLQGPGTPTISHAAPTPVPHPPPISHAPSSSMSSMSSPPPTPSSALPGPGRLNANSTAFVPGVAPPPKKVILKNVDGIEVTLETLTKGTPAPPTPTMASARQNPPGTPTRKSGPVRIETPEQQRKRLEEEELKEKQKAEIEEKAKREKEAEERRKKEEEERKKKEEEDRVRKVEEEKERLRKEKEEKERLRKEEEEKERRRKEDEEKERLRKEEEERERLKKEEEQREKERQRREEEDQRKRKEEEERRVAEEKAREEEERRKKEEEEKERIRKQEEEEAMASTESPTAAEYEGESSPEETKVTEDELTQEPEEGELPPSKDDPKDRSRESLRINTALSVSERRRPGPLDLTHSRQPSSPLTFARPLDDLGSVTYPEGIMSPKPELNAGAKEGKFRYDRDFLLQFMSICKEKPESLPPLDAIGLEPVDQLSLTRGGSGRHRQLSGTSAPSRQASVSGGMGGAGLRGQFQSMGQFTTSSKFGPGSERFEAAGARSVSMGGTTMPFRGPPLQRTASQGGPGGAMPSHRTRSKRGEKRTDATRATTGPQAHGAAFGQSHANAHMANFEPVAPLQMSENRWDRRLLASNDPDAPEVVDRKVKGLLNKLTMEKFDSISDQIIQWANRSENQKDGRTLIQVIRLVFEKATDEATWSEMYARLCRKMMEQISPKVQDEGIKNTEGKPIAGGQLFRKYLLNRCQEDFERGWFAKEATAAAAATKAKEDQAVKDANENNDSGEVVLYSDEYYAAQKAKRQGLGLIKFIGELFKLQMLTERIMHECIKKLLGNVENPEEEEIESLCKLMTTVGALLDVQKARKHMDVYFQRMKELTRSLNVSPRMQFMLQDVIELRERNWITRNTVAAPTTLAQVHEAAAKEKAAQEKESSHRMTMSRGGSRRGGNREDLPQADGWTVTGNTSRVNTKAGDLSQFGRISKAQQVTTFGPSSVFAGKKDMKREPLSRTNSSSNMFSMLQSSEAAQDANKALEPPQRRKLMLQPRTKPLEEQTRPAEESVTPSEEEAPTSADMTEEAAEAKIAEDVKEFFNIRNLEEAEVYFTTLPSQHHHRLVNKLVTDAVESKEPEAKLVADLFVWAKDKSLCSPDAFEEGLTPTAEIIEDIAIDAPKAWTLFAMMVRGADLDEEHRTRLASKSTDSDKLFGLLS